MKHPKSSAAAVCLALLASPAALSANIALGGLNWTTTGNAGLIGSTYGDFAQNIQLGDPGTGSPFFGYVSTYHEVIDFDQPYVNPSPLNLVPTVDKDGASYSQTNGSMVQSSQFAVNPGDRLVLHFNYVSTDGRDYEDYAWARLVDAGTNKTAAWLFTARSGNKPDADGTSDYVQGHVLSDQVGFDGLDSKDPDKKLAVVLPTVPGIIGDTLWAPLGPSAGQCWDPGTSCGYTGWVTSDFTAPTKDFASGNFYLQIGVSNWGDTALQTAMAFDFDGLNGQSFSSPTNVFDNAALVPEPQTWLLMALGLAAAPILRRRAANRR